MLQETQSDAVVKRAKLVLPKLLKNKNFDSVTVKDITEECGFSRQYFYRFFTDKYALLREIFEYDLKTALGSGLFYDKKVNDILVALWENRALYRSAIDSSGYTFLYQMFFQSGMSFALAIVESSAVHTLSAEQTDALGLYLAGVTTTLLRSFMGYDQREIKKLTDVFLNNLPASLAFLRTEQTTTDYILFKVHKLS
jgi:AcrR family transcriptional regulator